MCYVLFHSSGLPNQDLRLQLWRETWAYINQIKQQLCELVDNDNDG